MEIIILFLLILLNGLLRLAGNRPGRSIVKGSGVYSLKPRILISTRWFTRRPSAESLEATG